MSRSPKYYGRAPEGASNVHFPGDRDGNPFRSREGGPPPPLTDAEYRGLVQECDVGVRVFDLSDPADLAGYRDLLDRAANGAVRLQRERQYDPEARNWRVLCEWAVVYATNPVARG